MGLFDAVGAATKSILGGSGGGFESSRGSQVVNGTVTKRRIFDQAAIDKTIYDIMSSDQGLSALANAENASGGYGSSTKTLQAQDLIAKVAGTIAQITAPEVTETDQKTVEKKTAAGLKTVICTWLATNGYISLSLYLRGMYYHSQMSPVTRAGYLAWANQVVEKLPESPRLRKVFSYLTTKRYQYLVGDNRNLVGAASVWIGEPICYLIGCMVITREFAYG